VGDLARGGESHGRVTTNAHVKACGQGQKLKCLRGDASVHSASAGDRKRDFCLRLRLEGLRWARTCGCTRPTTPQEGEPRFRRSLVTIEIAKSTTNTRSGSQTWCWYSSSQDRHTSQVHTSGPPAVRASHAGSTWN
jgi:hypothetical protein